MPSSADRQSQPEKDKNSSRFNLFCKEGLNQKWYYKFYPIPEFVASSISNVSSVDPSTTFNL